ncbi:MAG: insulinase family protein [Deltaproteobacteria bacterium]|nr:insulinase family protein [Deltaproteobacteria bacterium]
MFKRYQNIFLQIFTAIVFILFFSLQPSASHAEPLKTTLENGMTVILEENHSAPVAAFQMWVKVGSADEDGNIAGIAHVFEHMLFKGTAKRKVGEVAKEIEAAGGSIHAFTSYDHTVYHLVLASRFFDKGLDIISDAIQNSSFDPDELAKETDVVLEELKMGEDSPDRKLYLKLLGTSYTLHPYKRPVIGFRDTVKNLKRDDILTFFKKWYIPNNMTLVVVGDFDSKKALEDIKNSFKDFKSKDSPRKERLIEPEQIKTKGFVLKEEIKEARLGLAFHVPYLGHPDIYAIDALALILGQGESSRLYQRLKGRDTIVNSISSYAMTPKEPGIFFITSSLDLGLEAGNAKKAIQGILEEIKKIEYEGVSNAELEKAKLNLESEFVFERETREGRARQLGYFETSAGGLDYEKRYLEGIKKLTAKDIQKAAEKYLNKDNMTIGLIAPKAEKDILSLDEVLKTVSASVVEAEKLYKEGQGARGKGQETIKIKLDNNITLIIKEDHTNPTVAIHAAFLGGVRLEHEKTNGLSNFIANMLTKGTNKRTALEIAKELDGMAGGVGGFSGRNSIGISGKFLSRFFDKGFEIFADCLQNPAFPEDEIEKARKEILAGIKSKEDYLPGWTFKIFNETLFEKHPYKMDVLGTEELIKNYKREDLLKFYEALIYPEGMVMSVVGDVNTNDVIEQTKRLFNPVSAGLPSNASIGGLKQGFDRKVKPIPSPSYEKRQTAIRKKEIVKEKQQAHIAIGFLGTTITSQDKYILQVLSGIMSSQGGRLFIELRDKKALAYSVSAVQRDGIEPGFIAVYMGTSPDKINDAVNGILSELEKVVKHGVTDEELKRAKSELIGNYEIGLQESSSQASDMTFNELYGLGYDEQKKFAKKIESITKQDILNAARKYIDLSAYTIVIVRPEANKK